MNLPKEKLKQIKKKIIEISARTKEGHIPSAFSILDILWILYDRVMRFDPTSPDDENRDRLIVSKGHSSLGIYAVLAEKGYFPAAALADFGNYESILGGHPDRNKVPGIEASTGSLGHGLPMAVGVALGLKIKRSSAKVFTIVGDGECNEGTIWESLLLAAHHNLSNLTCIVDFNRSTDRALKIDNLEDKFKAFGFSTRLIDGHCHDEIYDALAETTDRPKAIIACTVKGYGCKPMENNPAWHHRAPADTEIDDLIRELS